MGKKIMGLLLVALISLTGQAQKQSFKPYVGVGVTRYADVYSPGIEAGMYSKDIWYALAYTNTEGDHYGSARMYVRTYTVNKLDNFLWGGINTPLKDMEISYELGTAFVCNLTDKFAPQISVSVPFPTDKFRVAFGMSLNYWIK